MIGVLVSGNGSNLQALLEAGLPVAAVGANRKDAYALVRARAAGIPSATFGLDCHASREERDLVMATWLEAHDVELVVLAGYMHLLTEPFLDRFPGRIVNVHPSLLPAFPGAHAIEDALAAGVEQTGVTIHLVDEGLDSGPDPPAGGRRRRAAGDARAADPRGRAPAAARGGQRDAREALGDRGPRDESADLASTTSTASPSSRAGFASSASSSSPRAGRRRSSSEHGLEVTRVEDGHRRRPRCSAGA